MLSMPMQAADRTIFHATQNISLDNLRFEDISALITTFCNPTYLSYFLQGVIKTEIFNHFNKIKSVVIIIFFHRDKIIENAL